MSENVESCKIFTPNVSSLLHFSSVKVGVLLLKNFDSATLSQALKRIQQGELIFLDKNYDDPSLIRCKRSIKRKRSANREDPLMMKCDRAQENLLLIPPRLRKNVMEAVCGLECGAQRWKARHAHIISFIEGEFIFHWRSDGTLDENKTVQHLVLNKNFDIQERFNLACMYCLEESIKVLWVERQASQKSRSDNSSKLLTFWKRRMRNGSRVPWTRAALRFLDEYPNFLMATYSTLFPFLQPKERKNILESLDCARGNDIRVFAHAMTKKEEEHILLNSSWCPLQLLRGYLDWPLRSFFLEKAEKMWSYIDERSFYILLEIIFSKQSYGGFDYWELFEDFWNNSPNHLREKVKGGRYMRVQIDSWFNEMRNKRKSHSYNQSSSKQSRIVET